MALLCAFINYNCTIWDGVHFVGKDFQDDYSTVLKEYVNNFDLNSSVLSMMQHDIQHILSQSTLEYWPQQLRDFR
jgi:hypothetical protein